MNNHMPGILITIEGIDGAGKSSLVQALGPLFATQFPRVITTKEPGGSALGIELRALLQYQEMPIAPRAEYLLFAADRAQHFHEVIIPGLKEGALIISDRMADSSLAYQGYGRGHDYTILEIVNQWSMHGIKPDLTLYLKIPIHVAYERLRARAAHPTIFEQEKQEFLERVARGFDRIFAQRSNVFTIDATQDFSTIITQAQSYIQSWLSIHKKA